MVHLPPRLRRGDRVYIASPSGPVVAENLAEALGVLDDWGLDVELDRDVYARAEPGYFAGEDQGRLDAIHRAFDSDSSAILFSRGGYGLTRIVDRIAFERLEEHPKWVVGFSDITAFHLAGRARGLSLTTIHGHVAKSFGSQRQDLASLRALLFDHALPDGIELVPCGETGDVGTAPIVGGNCSLVAAMLDSDDSPDFDGSVLFLEDVGEADYRVDRLLTSIATSRRARGIRGVILGDFTNCGGVYVDDQSFSDFLDRLGRELSVRLECPVYRGLPSGHGDRNIPIPIGWPAAIRDNALYLEAPS